MDKQQGSAGQDTTGSEGVIKTAGDTSRTEVAAAAGTPVGFQFAYNPPEAPPNPLVEAEKERRRRPKSKKADLPPDYSWLVIPQVDPKHVPIVVAALRALNITGDKKDTDVYFDPMKNDGKGGHAVGYDPDRFIGPGITRPAVKVVRRDGHAHIWIVPEELRMR